MTINKKIPDEITDFEKLKMELSKARTTLKVGKKFQDKNKNRQDLPAQYFESECAEIANMEEKILQLEAILATEPPAPELPPCQPLIKVVGILEEFRVQKIMGYFGAREYDPEAFAREEERNQVGSLLLAITGNVVGSAVTGQSQVRLRDCSDFVRGKINGIPFHGWLGKTHVRNDDYVEMAVIAKDDHYVVYAIMFPEVRTLSITPRCRCGREADIRFATFYASSVLTTIFLVILVIFFFKGLDWEGLAGISAMFAATMILVFAIATRKTRKKPEPTFRLAENIFAILGFSDPQDVDLRTLTKKRIKALSSNSSHVTDREMPSRRSAWVDYFYYY